MSTLTSNNTLPNLQRTIDKLLREFNQITEERKVILKQLTDWMKKKSDDGQKVLLNFICTHNSRRSHIAQIWAQTAAHYYGIANVETFSGGTEATAFNPRAVKAMQEAGFEITTWK